MWGPNEPAEEDLSDLPGADPPSKHRRSSRRAWRDGLEDQTVVTTLERIRSYRAFERAVVGSIDPRSVIELALAHRLASLLWRLRRASAIETGLFELQSEFLLAHGQDPSGGPNQPEMLPTSSRADGYGKASGSNARHYPPAGDQEPLSMSMRPSPLAPRSKARAIAQCFLRLSNVDPTLLDRAGSYEARLWRQAAQTIWILKEMRRPSVAPTRRLFRRSAGIAYWDAER
jgi:hypothetical protein